MRPSFFFHVTTALDILRYNCVPIGKRYPQQFDKREARPGSRAWIDNLSGKSRLLERCTYAPSMQSAGAHFAKAAKLIEITGYIAVLAIIRLAFA
jgi:hypothetical protein